MSLRTKLTLAFVLVSLIGAGATGAALIYGSFRAQLEQIAEKKLLLVENRAHRLEDDLNLVAAELTRLSTLAEVDLADGDLEPEKRVLRYARKDSALFQMQVLLIDDQGTLLWEEPQRNFVLGQSFGALPWFRSLHAAGHPSVDDTGDTLRVAVPILRNEQFSGALVGILDRTRPDLLSRDAPLDLASSGAAAVLSDDGAARFELGDAAGLTALRDSRAATMALAGQTGKIWDTDAQGRGWLYAFAPIPTAHWALVVREARDELDDDLTKEVRTFVALLLGGLLLALATGLVLARRITRPLASLSQQVEAIAQGRFGEPAPSLSAGATDPRDELEAFGQAFAEMQQAIAQRDRTIREARDTLEMKVDERTRELREAQGALLVSNRFAAMGKTAAAIAHELKNALNGLGVSIDLLTQGQLPRERGDAVRVQVRSEIARLRDISDNLNLVGAAPRLSLEPTDLHRLIEHSLELLSDSIAAGGVEVQRHFHREGAPLPLRCDVQKIRTTLLNLIKNAVEAMAPASFGDPLDRAPTARPRLLSLATAPSVVEGGDGVLLEISDTGAGFSNEARTHLFEPFFTTKRTGTGLGLTIAHRVVEAHGGALSVFDQDGRTVMRLWLPLEPGKPATPPEPRATLH